MKALNLQNPGNIYRYSVHTGYPNISIDIAHYINEHIQFSMIIKNLVFAEAYWDSLLLNKVKEQSKNETL